MPVSAYMALAFVFGSIQINWWWWWWWGYPSAFSTEVQCFYADCSRQMYCIL